MKDVCFIFIPKLWDMIQCDLHMYLFKFWLKQRIGQTHLVASTWPKILKTCRSVHEKTTFVVNSGRDFSVCFFLRKLHHDPRVLEILYRIESWLSYAGTPGAAEMVGPEIVHARPGVVDF